jgi:cytoskeletal protein CcmA (bactofilin family)
MIRISDVDYKMNDTAAYTNGESFVNSIIGEGTSLSGDFELNGLLRIDGTFSGRVRTSGKVLIGKNGEADCEIVAGTVVIGGKVKGEIIATERITLLSTGVLIGNIVTPRLIIEEGVVYDGRCEIVEDKDKLEKIKQEYLLTREEARAEQPKPVKESYMPAAAGLEEEVLADQARIGKGFEPQVEQKVT